MFCLLLLLQKLKWVMRTTTTAYSISVDDKLVAKANRRLKTDNFDDNLESVVGSVIQASGTVELEDGLRSPPWRLLPKDSKR